RIEAAVMGLRRDETYAGLAKTTVAVFRLVRGRPGEARALLEEALSAQPDDAADRTQLANPLRDAGFTVAIDYSARPLDRQLESAVKHGAKVAVIRGTEEARGGHVIVRDLLAKEQRVTRLAAVVTEVGRHVPRRPKPTLASPGPAQPTGEA
ncbi:MAG: His/Gly/Thr/Pro-type tRNA ligase C-terminal domain-containing protein, partial [Chloroflexota bacterium]